MPPPGSSPPEPFAVSARVESIRVDRASIVALRRYWRGLPSKLDGDQLGMLAVLFDAGRLPVPERVQTTKEIGRALEAIADRSGVVQREDEFLLLHSEPRRNLADAALALWRDRSEEARTALRGRPQPLPRSSMYLHWLRSLALLIAARGLRLTSNGELHGGDLRPLSSAADMPSRRFLERTAGLGRALGVLFELPDRLLLGEELDVLDLDDGSFAHEVLRLWLDGDLPLAWASVSTLGGAFSAWGTATTDTGRPLVDDVPDPVSPWLRLQPGLAHVGRTMLLSAHRRWRSGLIAVLSGLPPGRLALRDVVRAIQSTLAEDALETPPRLGEGQRDAPSVAATLCHLLPGRDGRTQDAFVELVGSLLEPLGLAAIEGDDVLVAEHLASTAPIDDVVVASAPFQRWLTSSAEAADHRAPKPRGTGVYVQPNGEVMAPMTAPIHALLHIAQGAQLLRFDQMVVFQITPRTLLRVVDAGMDLEAWLAGLGELSAVPLPHTVIELVAERAARQGELQVVEASAVVIARDRQRLAELLSHRRFRELVVFQASDTCVILRRGTELSEVVDELAEKGFSAVVGDRVDVVE